MWFIGVEVEQETSAPPPIKNSGSAPVQYAFEKGLFTNESQDIIKQYLRFNLNGNQDDDENDCIKADDINNDDQDAHSNIDGDGEDSDEKDSQNSNNINNNIIHNFNKTL